LFISFKKRLFISHVGYLVSEGNITVSDKCRDLARVCRIICFKGGSDVTGFTVVTAALWSCSNPWQ